MQGCGCPRCNESHLERDTNILLNECKIKPNREKKFDWLLNDKTNFALPLDFYLEEYNIAIECQVCKENGIRLLYITNKKFKRYLNQKQFNGIYDNNVYFIEDLLENNVQLFNILNGN